MKGTSGTDSAAGKGSKSDDVDVQGPLRNTVYQHVSSAVLDAANRLRVLGVNSVLNLPTLVIAGDQSSGKSSVVEAIAGVSLPRSDGTCTRCPTEVRMRTARAATVKGGGAPGCWSCCIKLCREYNSDGLPLKEKPPEEHFCTVLKESHIAACVTAAQAVLLNPKSVSTTAGGVSAFVPDLSGSQPKEAHAFRALKDAAGYELGFTSNKVVLEISGAEADLTIIDLPGIIHNHPKGQHYVEMVERMTKMNLEPDHHIIAMALPAGLDPETQAIRLWTRGVDPSGSRSIGIVTKPDTVKEEEHTAQSKLVGLVSGVADDATTHLKLGYYVVKNPGQEQLKHGVTFKQAREAEKNYFSTSPHWANAVAKSVTLAQRLGADNLRAGLSALLIEQILAQLPEMRRSAREKLTGIQEELRSMPPPPSADALQEFRTLIWKATGTLKDDIRAGAAGDKFFYRGVMETFRSYGDHMICSTPAFLVGRTLISALNNTDKGVGAHGSDRVAEGELELKDCKSDADAEKFLAENEGVKETLRKALFPSKYMTLKQVVELQEQHRGRELPSFSPYSAVEELIQKFKGQWSEHARECLETVKAQTQKHVEKVVASLFDRYPSAHRLMIDALSEYLEELSAETSRQIQELVAMEDQDTFTLNNHYLSSQLNTFLGRLKRAYIKPPELNTDGQKAVQEMMGKLAGYGVKFNSYEDMFMAQRTPVDDVLHMMAACLAYFKVAFKRVLDGVPMAIRHTLLHRLADQRGLEAAVTRQMRGGDDQAQMDMAEVARSLLAEDDILVTKRTQLADMEQRLRKALVALHSPALHMQ